MSPRRHRLVFRLAAVLATGAGPVDLSGAEPAPPPAAKEATAAGPATKAPAVPAKPATPHPLAPRFKQVQDRITVLFQHRNQPPPPPSPITNPFRNPGALMLRSENPLNSDPKAAKNTAIADGETAPLTDQELLERGAETLRISGLFEVGERTYVVVNARPFKLGDVVQAFVRGEAVFLRIKEIGKRSVTFTLNKAETTVTF